MFFALLSMHLHGQALVDFYRLDTVVFNRQLNGINPRSSTVSTCNATHLFYLNKSRNKATDTLIAYQNNLATKEAVLLKLRIPGYSSLSSRYDIAGLTANEHYLGVALSDRIELFDIQKGIGPNGLLAHVKTIALGKEYTFYKIIDNRTIILGDCYNYSKKSNKPQTELAVLDIVSGKVQKVIAGIDFKAIEFTHFNPKHFIDASGDRIAFAQTARYEIELFDRSLNKADVIKRSMANWKEIDNFLLDNIRESFDPNNIVPIIDTLSYYDDHDLSRIEGAWFMGNNSLMIRYTMNVDGKKNRYYDVYAKDGKEWALKDSNIIEIKIPVAVNDTITKDNFLIWPSNYHTVLHENGIVMIRNYADIPYLGDTWKNIYKRNKTTMKRTSRYIRSSIISASISLALLLLPVFAQSQPFSVVGFGSKVLSTDSIITKNTLFILTSETSCTGCKDNLSAYLNSLKIDTSRFDIVIVNKIRVITPLLKRELYNEIRTYYSKASKIYFDASTDSTSMFQYFKVKQTPTLILFNKSSRTWDYEGYKEVFDGIYLSKRIKQQLPTFFKELN